MCRLLDMCRNMDPTFKYPIILTLIIVLYKFATINLRLNKGNITMQYSWLGPFKIVWGTTNAQGKPYF